MKAISLHEPYASLIACGFKTIETRSWSTTHRGPLLICAAKRRQRPDVEPLIQPFVWDRLPFGKAVCVADIAWCRPMVPADETSACCKCYPGVYAWGIAKIRKIEEFDVRGKQGFFYVDDSLIQYKVSALAEKQE